MMEISRTDHPGQRRVDEYKVIPGDIEFETRRFETTGFRVVDQEWFKSGMTSETPRMVQGCRLYDRSAPSIAFVGPDETVYQERQGVLAVSHRVHASLAPLGTA